VLFDRAVIGLAQPPKRAQGGEGGRKFDDLFGSRVWKGRSSVVLYLEQDRVTVWKQRGGYIRRRWGGAVGRIVRSDTGPTTILVPQTAAESEADRETAILNAVTTEPGKWSKSSLIEDKLKVPGRARSDWVETVDRLSTEGRIKPEGQFRKLFPVKGE
jgi:hypothetical protein